jgi:DNA-binding transcriptional MerR regulator
MSQMAAKLYKIGDLALRLDRSILTIKRWEKQGLIPKARKDSRGWRVYTEDEVRAILKKVRESNYFRSMEGVEGAD